MSGIDSKRTPDQFAVKSLNNASAKSREVNHLGRATLIAPLVYPVLVNLWRLTLTIPDDPSYTPAEKLLLAEKLFNFVFSFVILYLPSLIALVVLGLPVVAILSRIGRLRIWTLMIIGMVQGILLGCLEYFFWLDVGSGHGLPPRDFDIYRLVEHAGQFGLVGLLVASVFGFVAKIRFR